MLNNKYSGGLYRSNLATRSSCHDQLEMLCDSRTPSQAWGCCTCGHCQSSHNTALVNPVWKWVCFSLEYYHSSKESHEYFTMLALRLHVITAFTHDAWLSFSEKKWGGGALKAWISFALNQNKLWFKIPLNALITKWCMCSYFAVYLGEHCCVIRLLEKINKRPLQNSVELSFFLFYLSFWFSFHFNELQVCPW